MPAVPPGLRPLGFGLFGQPRTQRDEFRTGVVTVGQLTQIVPDSDWRHELQLANAGPAPVLVSNNRDDLLAVPPRGLRIPANLTPVAAPPRRELWGTVDYTRLAVRAGFNTTTAGYRQRVELVSQVAVGPEDQITVSAWLFAPAGQAFWWTVGGWSPDLTTRYDSNNSTRLVGTGAWQQVTRTITGTSAFFTPPTSAYLPALYVAADERDPIAAGQSGYTGYDAAFVLSKDPWAPAGPVWIDFLDIRLTATGNPVVSAAGVTAASFTYTITGILALTGPGNSEFLWDRGGGDTRPLRWVCVLNSSPSELDTDALPGAGGSFVSGGILSMPAPGAPNTRQVWSENTRAAAGQQWNYEVRWTNPAGLTNAIMILGAYNAASAYLGDLFSVNDPPAGTKTYTGTVTCPANTHHIKWRLHNHNNAAGTITVDYARLTPTAVITAPTGDIAAKDGFRGAATLTFAETRRLEET